MHRGDAAQDRVAQVQGRACLGVEDGFDRDRCVCGIGDNAQPVAAVEFPSLGRDVGRREAKIQGMKPAGLREVERAKDDGRWEAAYEPQSTATVPEDLRLALEKNDRAREFFETLDSTNRYAILHRIQDAKKPETRARRIAKYVAMLAEGKKPYP